MNVMMGYGKRWIGLCLLAGLFHVGPAQAAGSLSIDLLFTIDRAEPDGRLLKPGGIDCDTLRGEIYLADRGRKEVLVYDEAGRFLRKIDRSSGIRIPFRLLVDPSGTLIVGEERESKLRYTDLTGRPIGEESLIMDPDTGILPGGMAIGTGGDLLVVDRFGEGVWRINRMAGRPERFFDPAGRDDGKIELQDIALTREGKAIIISSKGYGVRVIDPAGIPMTRFGAHGSQPSDFSFPISVAIDRRGRLWVVDTFQHAVKVFLQDGTFVTELGGMGTEPGRFFFPVDITFGSDNRLYVLEKGVPRFQAFQVHEPDEEPGK